MVSSDNEQIHALSQRILAKCARELGGAAALAKHLGISESTLAEWLSGGQVPPVEAIMKAIAPLISAARGATARPDKEA
jgi:transcriptional regulator with XRE-family HTH domain